MGTQSEGLRILLLGPMRVNVGDERLRISGRAQRIAVARLALAEGRPVSVASFIEDLWSDKRPKDPVHALQAHIHRLRGVLPLDIEYVNDGYRLADDGVQVDAKEFEELSERGRISLAAGHPDRAAVDLDDALALWRGQVLSDIDDIPGLRPFALHLSETRRRTESDRVEALLQCGRGEPLIAQLRASLAIDPLQETAWHQLMRALWHSGQEAEALSAYTVARETFVDLLGAEPGTRLSELHRTLLQGSAPVAERRGVVPPLAVTVPSTGTGLIGRRDELSSLEQAWARSRDGLQIVTVSGEPGIGKSHLADALLRRVSASGALALRGHCDPAASVAYQPFAEMFRQYQAARTDGGDAALPPRAAVLADILATHAPGGDPRTTQSAVHEADPHATMDAITAWLAAHAADEPLLLCIDDLHWADEQTLLTLRHMLRSPRRIRALVVVCMRATRDPRIEGAQSDVLLRQSDLVTHIPLTRLHGDEVAQLVAAERAQSASTGRAPEWFDEYVLDASGGNPLFVVELTRQLLIADPSTADALPAVPAGIRSVIWGRVNILPEQTRRVLQHAAVIGKVFDVALLADLAAQSVAEADAALTPARDAQLIEAAGAAASSYTFSHDVVRTALYESLPVAERAVTHGRIAELLPHDASGDMLLANTLMAHHLRRSGAPDAADRAAEHLLLAGRESYSRGALADAANLLTDALMLLGDGGGEHLRCDLLLALGPAQLRLARQEYRSTLLEASRLAVAIDDPHRLMQAVLANNRGWWSSTIQIDHERIAHIETALARCPEGEHAARAQLLAAWAIENVRDVGARAEVLEAIERSLQLAELSADDRAVAEVLRHRYAVLYALFEAPTECVQINQRLLELATRLGDPRLRLSAAVGLAQSSMRLGEYTLADRYLSEAVRLAEALEDPARTWLVRGWQAMRDAIRGRFASAEQLMLDTLNLGTRTGQGDAFTWFAGQLFTLRMLQGRLAEIVDQVRDQVTSVADGIPSWRAALALTLARTGDHDGAAAILEEYAADDFERIPRDMLWLNGLHYFVMTCDALGREDVAGALYGLLLPYSGMVASNGTIGAGPVDLHLGVLAILRRQHDVAERHLTAAAALCRRVDAPVWLELAEERLATLATAA